jgi:electron transfer flavoprotein alpha/beta subunit
MSLVVIADGVVAVEGTLKPGPAESLFSEHPLDRDLADDSVVEEALRLKKRLGVPLTLVSFAPAAFEKHMRAYMAAGCDRAVRIDADPVMLQDARVRAHLVAEVLRSVTGWRVALCLDRTSAGAPALVPHHAARLLGVPSVSQVVSAEPEGNCLCVVTRGDGMIRTYRASGPVVLAVSSRAALRNASFMDVHRSRKQAIEAIEAASLPGFEACTAHPAATCALRVQAPPEPEREVRALQLSVEETVERIAAICAPYLVRTA